jgi:hypothetical protein
MNGVNSVNKYKKFEYKKECMENISLITSDSKIDLGKAKMKLLKKVHNLEAELITEKSTVRKLAIKDVIQIYKTLLK